MAATILEPFSALNGICLIDFFIAIEIALPERTALSSGIVPVRIDNTLFLRPFLACIPRRVSVVMRDANSSAFGLLWRAEASVPDARNDGRNGPADDTVLSKITAKRPFAVYGGSGAASRPDCIWPNVADPGPRAHYRRRGRNELKRGG